MKMPIYTDEQLEELEKNSKSTFVVKPGVYDFIVKDVVEELSKAGNEMLTVKLLVDINGKTITVTDWWVVLPATHDSHAFSVRKMKNRLEAIKLPYAEDSLRPNRIMNKEGKVLLKLEYNKDKKRDYAKVDMYMTEDLLKKYYHEHESTAKPTEDFDDDIPF